MFASLGRTPKFTNAPTFVFDLVISFFQAMATWTHLESLENSAEYARIGKYYAVEDMLTTRPDEKYGKITVQDHYNTIAAQGQDPFTPMYVLFCILNDF
jgi:divinyl chlorophyllide a 8-vinyl-reductase